MKRIFNKFFAVFVCLSIIFPVFTTSASATDITFTAKAVSDYGKKSVTLDILTTECGNVGGMLLQISYDKQKVSFVEKSVVMSAVISTAKYNHLADSGSILIAWYSLDNGAVFYNNLLSLQFAMQDNYVFEGAFTVTVKDIYTADVDSVTLNSDIAYANTNIGSVSTKAQAVIDKISDIGDVSLTDECLQKIVAAEQAYAALTISERDAVTNYSVLVNARKTYTELAQEELNANNKSAAEAFIAVHPILQKTVDMLVYSDKEAVESAINDWNSLNSNVVKALLIGEKNKLNLFMTRISELEQIEKDKEAEEELKSEAQNYLNEFNKDYYYINDIKLENLTPDYRSGLEAARDAVKAYNLMNTYTIPLLESKLEFIEEALSVIDKLEKDKADDESGILSLFNQNYSTVSTLTADSVTKDNESDIMLLYQLSMLMQPDEKKSIKDKITHLETLIAALDALPEESMAAVSDSYSSTMVVSGKTAVNTALTGNKISAKNKKTVVSTKPIILVSVLSILALLLSIVFYLIADKKYKIGGESCD